jgi:hypothetical protein
VPNLDEVVYPVTRLKHRHAITIWHGASLTGWRERYRILSQKRRSGMLRCLARRVTRWSILHIFEHLMKRLRHHCGLGDALIVGTGSEPCRLWLAGISCLPCQPTAPGSALADQSCSPIQLLRQIARVILLKANGGDSEETRRHLHDAHGWVISIAAVQQHLQSATSGNLMMSLPNPKTGSAPASSRRLQNNSIPWSSP